MPPKGLAQVSPVAAQIGPEMATVSRHVPISTRLATLIRLGRRVITSYNKVQISHRGMYSVEKLQAFQCYSENTSIARAVAVCLLTPLPPLLVIVLLECIPLSDPALGWKANYMFWVRFLVSGIVLEMGLTYQVIDMIDGLELSFVKCLAVAVVGTTMYMLTLMAIASAWVFPVPFSVILGVGPAFIVYLAALCAAIGQKKFKEIPTLAQQLKLHLYVMGVQSMLVMVYPAFSALYFEISPQYRAGLILLLPVVKLISKNIVAWACAHVEEYVPVVAVFSIEVFNALYVATCMQTTNSGWATIVIIGFDAIHASLSFYALKDAINGIRQQHLALSHSPVNLKNAACDIVTSALLACQQLRTFRSTSGKSIRVRSVQKHFNKAIQPGQRALLTQLDTHLSVSKDNPKRSQEGANQPNTAIFGTNFKEHEQVAIVESTLGLLFRCEYLALVEFIECAVPILYGIYMCVLSQLPSHEYFPQTRDKTPEQLRSALVNLSMYVALEIVSFVIIHNVVKRRLGLSPLMLLAFTLETEAIQLQSRMFVWIVFILQFTLQHYGVDFTFHFAWIK